MNHSFLLSKMNGAALAAIASFAFLSAAHAQTDYYFDPSATASGTGSGGNGTWDTGSTQDWYVSGPSDTTFPTAAAGNANFDGVGGTVSVVGSVDPAAINFDGSSAYTVNAGAGGSIDLGTATNFNIDNTGAGVTLNAPITFASGTGDISVNVNSTGGGFVFGSTVTNNYTSDQIFNLYFSGGGTDEFSGNILATNSGYQNNSGDPTNDNINVTSNTPTTLLVDNGNFQRFTVTTGNSLLTNGAVTVVGTDSIVNGTIGGATADESTFTGKIINFGGSRTFTAFAGGRVDFTGTNAPGGDAIEGGGVGAGNHLIINGDGIVAFTTPGGSSYASQYNTLGNDSAVGTEVSKGTLLLENTVVGTSATGNGANQNGTNYDPIHQIYTVSTGSNDVVQIDSNPTGTAATLGGFGYTYQEVMAMGAKSAITPGDVAIDGTITPGTLHLDNGLNASNGLTANFKLTLNPTTGSKIELSSTTNNPQNGNVDNGADLTPLVLSGNLTFNLSGVVTPFDTYTLFESTTGTAWDLTGADYTVTGAPTGYSGRVVYFADVGGLEVLDVEIVPEPSTWALLGLGCLVLISSGKFRKFRA